MTAVRSSNPEAVAGALASKFENKKMTKEPRPELLLLLVDGAPRYDPCTKLWRWTAFSEAARKLPSTNPPEESKEMRTLMCLLKKARDHRLELDHFQMCKTDTQATCMHEAVYSANWHAVAKMSEYTMWLINDRPQLVYKYKGKLSLWAESRSGWLPYHTACLRRSPAYSHRSSQH